MKQRQDFAVKEEGAHKFTIDFHLFKGGADFAISFGRLGEFGSRLVRFVKLSLFSPPSHSLWLDVSSYYLIIASRLIHIENMPFKWSKFSVFDFPISHSICIMHDRKHI